MTALASQHNVVNINIPSSELERYDKNIQTEEIAIDSHQPQGQLHSNSQATLQVEFESTPRTPRRKVSISEDVSDHFVAHATHLAAKALQASETQNLRKNYAEDEARDVGNDKVSTGSIKAQLARKF